MALVNPSHSLWNEYKDPARKAVATINLLGVEQNRPLLLAAIKSFSPKEMVNLLLMSVSWSVRLLIAGTQGTGALESLYGAAAHQISSGKAKSASDVAVVFSKSIPTDEQFEKDFAQATVSKAHLARYYLRALESQAQNTPEPYFVPNQDLVINLEHIMPELPSSEWSHIPEQTREDYSTRLGNQALLRASVNSKLGNKGWDSKRAYLEAAEFLLTREPATSSQWTEREIENRQKRLAQLAVKTWPLKTK